MTPSPTLRALREQRPVAEAAVIMATAKLRRIDDQIADLEARVPPDVPPIDPEEDGEPFPMPPWAVAALVLITLGIGGGVAWVLS